MHGRTSVPTITGAIVSFLVINVMLVYSLTKFSQLMRRHNPTVASFNEQGAIDATTIFNFRDNNIRLAFTIEGFLDNELKVDPRYVKLLARLWHKRNGV